MFLFRTRLPDHRLTPYLKMYFYGKDDAAPPVQRTVPNGEMGLCIYRGRAVRYDGLGLRQSCLMGQRVRYQDILSDGAIEIVGAHFTTLGAHAFFRLPLRELFGHSIPLSELQDTELTILEERAMQASTPEACWDLLDDFFLHRLANTEVNLLTFRRLQRAIAYGQRHLADAHIDQVASEACLSQRHFSRLFSDVTGISPKEYLRLQRYHHTLHELKADQGRSTLSEIAWRNGYYDYSHLFADFRQICGYSPTRLLQLSDHNEDLCGWRL